MPIFHGNYVVGATFILNFVAIGTFNSAALFVVPMENTFVDAGRGTIDFLPTIYLAVALFAAMGAGWLQDTLQKNGLRIEPVFSVGALCMGLGAVYSSFGVGLSQVLTGAVVTGIGIGLTGFTAAGVCVLWFQKNRGTMLLLAMAGQGLGGFVYCNGMQKLLDYYEEIDGVVDPWRPSMRAAGIFSMMIAVLASVFMRLPNEGEVEEHEKNESDDTETKGSDDDNHVDLTFIEETWGKLSEVPEEESERLTSELTPLRDASSSTTTMPRFKSGTSRQRISSIVSLASTMTARTNRRSSVSFGQDRLSRQSSLAEFEALAHLPVNFAAAAAEEQASSAMHKNEPTKMEELTPGLPYLSISQAFYTRTSLSLLGWCSFSCFAYTNYVVHLPAFATSVGLSPAVGAGALSLTGLAMLLGNITLGRITDIVGPIRMLQITMVLLMVVFFVWPYVTDAKGVMILACVYGYAATTQGSVPLIIMADAFGASSPDSILTLLGILNFAKFPGYLFGPTICGSLYERDGDYFTASVFTGVIMLIGNLFLFALPSTEQQNKILQEMSKSDASA